MGFFDELNAISMPTSPAPQSDSFFSQLDQIAPEQPELSQQEQFATGAAELADTGLTLPQYLTPRGALAGVVDRLEGENEAIRQDTKDDGVFGAVDFLSRPTNRGFSKAMPFAHTPAMEAISLLRAVQAQEAGTANPLQQRLIQAYNSNQDLQKTKNKRAQSLEMLSQVPGFVVEMGLTGGLKKGAEALLGRTMFKGIKKRAALSMAKRIGVKSTELLAGGAARSLVMPHRTAETIASRRLSVATGAEDEGVATSFLKGWGSTVIELASEEAGGVVAGQLNKTKVMKALGKAWTKKFPNKTFRDFTKKISTAGGYNGLIGEMGEERLGEVLRGITGIESLPDLTDEVERKAYFDQLIVEAGAFAIPGVLGLTADVAMTVPSIMSGNKSDEEQARDGRLASKIWSDLKAEAGLPEDAELDDPQYEAQADIYLGRLQEALGETVEDVAGAQEAVEATEAPIPSEQVETPPVAAEALVEGAEDTFFHATSSEAAPAIREDGFKASVGDRSLGVTKGNGVFLYRNDKGAAEVFGTNFERTGQTAEVIETKVDGKIFDALESDDSIRVLAENEALIAELKSWGFVGIEGDELGQPVTFIFEPSAVKVVSTKQAGQPVQKPVEEKKAEPVEQPKAEPVKPKAAKKAVDDGTTLEDKSFRQERIKAARRMAGRPDAPKEEIQTLEDAEVTVIKTGMVDQAEQIASEINADKNRVTKPQETIALEIRLEELEADSERLLNEQNKLIEDGNAEQAEALQDQVVDTLDKIERLTSAGLAAGTRLSAWFSARRYRLKKAELLGDRLIKMATVSKKEKLTPEEASVFNTMKTQLLEFRKKVDKLEQEAAEAREKSDASDAAKNIQGELNFVKRTRKSADVAKDRESIKAQLRKLGTRVNSLLGAAGQGAEAMALYGQLARTYIEDGVTTLKDLQDRMIADVPDLTVTDVNEVLANRSTGQLKKAESDATKTMKELKLQARLTLELEDALKGTFVGKKTRRESSLEVKGLQKQINRLKLTAFKTEKDATRYQNIIDKLERVDEQLQGGFRDIKAKKPVAPERIKKARAALREAQAFMRTKDAITLLQDRIDNNNLDVAPARQTAIQSERLEKARLELRLLRREARAEIERLRPKTTGEKVLAKVGKVGATMRAARAVGEMSGLLRQGNLIISHQIVQGVGELKATGQSQTLKNLARNIGLAMKATFNANTAEAIQMALENDAAQFRRDKHGLQQTELGGRLSKTEEEFMDNYLEQIPIVGSIVRGSNRNQTVLLNLLRASAFDSVIEANPQWTDAQRDVWAKTVGAMSGRSSVLKKLLSGQGSQIMGLLAFAPNFAASRIEAPVRLAKNLADPQLRKESVKTMAGYLTMNATFIALATLAGGKVNLDDPDEFDYGRVSFGNTKIDLMAGINQPFRLMMMAAMSGLETAGLKEKTQRLTTGEAIFNFLKYKQSPLVGVPLQLMSGKDVFGKDKSRFETMVESITPLYWADVVEAMQANRKAHRAAATLGTAALGFFGGSAVTVDSELMRPDVRKIYKTAGLTRISPPSWDREHEWLKERKYIKTKKNLEFVFNSLAAQWLLQNKEAFKDNPDAKELIQKEMSSRRKEFKNRVPEFPSEIITKPNKAKLMNEFWDTFGLMRKQGKSVAAFKAVEDDVIALTKQIRAADSQEEKDRLGDERAALADEALSSVA